MIAAPSFASPSAKVYEQEQPWAAVAALNIDDLSESDDESIDVDTTHDVVSKEQSTVCTSGTASESSSSSDDSVTSLEDVDDLTRTSAPPAEVDADEIDVDELVAGKFTGHRSSILMPPATAPLHTAPPQDSAAVAATNTAPKTPTKIVARPRSSIKLASLQAPIPVHDKGSKWKQLPKPDLHKIQRTVSLPIELPPLVRTAGTVAFSNINIRSYSQTIGDNPSVSYGPPITLDWDYEECSPISVEQYEENRGERRKLRQMGLSYYQRVHLLSLFGHTEEDLKKAKQQANKDKFKRAVTKYFLPVQVLEDVAESGVRKTKRYLQRKRQSTV